MIIQHWRRLLLATAAFGLVFGHQVHGADLPQKDDPYYRAQLETLQRVMAQQPNTNRAKNVILFVGDGMGITTVTASRIYEGQAIGQDGVSHKLAFEQLPYAAFSRTYSSDAQVTNSAPSATAMVAGIKARNDTIGVDSSVAVGDCAGSKGHEVENLMELAEEAGKSTGAVTTTRITHATPAATYSHTPMRDWESDADMPAEAKTAGCIDIARQLVESKYGDGIEVALGGGRAMFQPNTMPDLEDPAKKGARKDGLDLTQAWLDRYHNSGAVVYDAKAFAAIDPANVDHLLGLFNRSHMEYEADRAKDKAGEPSLTEMTVKAIDILAKNPKGYVLMVEGGRIDHAHHEGNAYRALTDTVAFDQAIKAALDKVDLRDTLVVVTADHSHTFNIAGYPQRDNPILGVSKFDGKVVPAADGKPYTTLSYANGPGAAKGEREDLTTLDTESPDYKQQSLVPMTSETHGGEDVGIFATGPWAHLFQGVVDQPYIFVVMNYATGLNGQLAMK